MNDFLRSRIDLVRELRQARYERDELADLVADLRVDLAAEAEVRRLLMQHAPSDARDLTIYDQEEK